MIELVLRFGGFKCMMIDDAACRRDSSGGCKWEREK